MGTGGLEHEHYLGCEEIGHLPGRLKREHNSSECHIDSQWDDLWLQWHSFVP